MVDRRDLLRLDAELRRDLARYAVLHTVVMSHIGTDEILAYAVIGTPFVKIDATVTLDDLGGNQLHTFRAQALRNSKQDVAAKLEGHGCYMTAVRWDGRTNCPILPGLDLGRSLRSTHLTIRNKQTANKATTAATAITSNNPTTARLDTIKVAIFCKTPICSP